MLLSALATVRLHAQGTQSTLAIVKIEAAQALELSLPALGYTLTTSVQPMMQEQAFMSLITDHVTEDRGHSLGRCRLRTVARPHQPL